ncbi:MAG TPA: patatin-like phospholipase family protein [Longimicrobiales bacterium]|nr:patatin-like phospholipase family protein [Longimicrobiales bacterium]
MQRELRLGFAMGGGVSLGAFSGAALTEAMKLALVRARYRVTDPQDPRVGSDVPYDRIVVDVFSGASAGALSLVLMLRALAEPDPAPATEARLRQQFPDEFDRLEPARQQALIAAQHAQDLQERAWVHEVDIERLLGRRGDTRRDLRHAASILDRGAVDEIAARLLRFHQPPDFGARQLLGERVLFAATLSNLTAIRYDARREFDPDEIGLLALRDALTSRGHREVRVFDLRFTEAPRLTPGRWCRYHSADERPGEIGDLRLNRTWARIGATCIACGAFPFAFEPVVLRRKSYEYGPTLWNTQFRDRVDGDEVRMTYVDGGTFNNEPIREAFRLASFRDCDPGDMAFDRRIVFVDPRVDSGSVSFNVPVHTEFRLREPGWLGDFQGYRLQHLTSLERLGAHAGSVAGAILGEATGNEADKVFATRKRFQLRDDARRVLAESLRTRPTAETLQRLVDRCRALLRVNELDAEFPPVPHDLADELERVIAEEPDELGSLAGKAEAFLQDVAGAGSKARWLKALAYSHLDLLMDLGGKRDIAKVVAIAPLVEDHAGELTYRALPGYEVAGFAGFTSRVSREHQVDRARHATELIMRRCGLTHDAPDGAPPPPEFEHRQQFERELSDGMSMLVERAKEVVSRSHLPAIQRTALTLFIGGLAQEATAVKEPRRTVELRIQVPDDHYELDGEGLADRDRRPLRFDGHHVLVTSAAWRATQGWSGPDVDPERQAIRVDTQRAAILGGDRAFCHIELPAAARVGSLDDHPCPRLSITLTEADRGTTVPADRWRTGDDPPPSLEDDLL